VLELVRVDRCPAELVPSTFRKHLRLLGRSVACVELFHACSPLSRNRTIGSTARGGGR
jgi:hypothetical protein